VKRFPLSSFSGQREKVQGRKRKKGSGKKIHLPGKLCAGTLFPLGFLVPDPSSLFFTTQILFRALRGGPLGYAVLGLGASNRLIKIRNAVDSKGHLRHPTRPSVSQAVWLSFIP